MTTHRVQPNQISAALHAAQTAAQPTLERSIIMHNDTDRVQFTSQRLAKDIGFRLSNSVGMIATRIQRLATGKAGLPDEAVPGAQCKAEIREHLGRLAYGYKHCSHGMRSVSESISDWCGGGYSRPADEAALKEAGAFLGHDLETMKKLDTTRRVASRDYLTIRRQGLMPVMVAKIEALLSNDADEVSPTDEEIEAACNRAYGNALLFGDWAEAALIADDMDYHLGMRPKTPEVDSSQAEKANRIRETLADRQAEQAQQEAKALAEFDLDLAA